MNQTERPRLCDRCGQGPLGRGRLRVAVCAAATAMSISACAGGATEQVVSSAGTASPLPSELSTPVGDEPVVSPIVPGPYETIPPGELRFFAYGEGGDAETGALAGVRVAVIGDPQAWWDAVRDDAPAGWEALPPGYRVRTSRLRLESAPARFVTTGDDGAATATVDPAQGYLLCVVAADVYDVIAGCSQGLHNVRYVGGGFHVYLSGERAYVMSNDNDYRDGNLHYEQFLLRDRWGRDPVRVTFLHSIITDFGEEYFSSLGRLAVVHDDDIGTWWNIISQDDKLALSILNTREFPYYAAAEWSGSFRRDDLDLPSREQLGFLDVSSRQFDLAPAQYATIGTDLTAEIDLPPGDYLLCTVGSEDIGQCIYEDIAASRDTVVYLLSGGDAPATLLEADAQKAAQVLGELDQYLSEQREEPGA